MFLGTYGCGPQLVALGARPFSASGRVIDEAAITMRCDVARDCDWADPFPYLTDGMDPLDLTGKTLNLIVRPSFDHTTELLEISSNQGGISIDNAVMGLASIYVAQGTIEIALPIGEWVHFARLIEGSLVRELWRGPFVVHAGRIA